MWARRVFYNVDNGEVVRMWVMDGSFRLLTQSEEALLCKIENWGCIEWLEKDPAIESLFSDVDENGNLREVNVFVDVSGSNPSLVFRYDSVENIEDPYSIIDVLTGEI